MATLVLTAVGSLLGPIGGAVGALLGQAIDSRLLGPKGRQGPRLQDLKLQTSSYGAQIPKLFGTMRVAGIVIWATDLVEHRSRQGGGKGRPSTTTYSYSASFAVLLSARPVRSVGRIWADGNLLRGAAGDWKSETSFRLHLGYADQAADPFIASAEGGQATPAYRGCAYAVFENMALAPFGNRIPSLTFEVEADAGPLAVGAILEELSDGLVQGETPEEVRGFAASGDSMRGLIETLAQALPLDLQDDGEHLHLSRPDDGVLMLEAPELAEERSEVLAAVGEMPKSLTLSYYEPERDYQAGVQQARFPGGRRNAHIELPAALHADQARKLAQETLWRLSRERGRQSIGCGWKRLGVASGRLIRLPDDPGLWKVASRTVDRDGVRLDLKRITTGSMAVLAAEPGRNLPAPDHVHGPTIVHLLDLPNLTDTAPASPWLYVAAAGTSPGWRRASLLVSLDESGSWTSIGTTAEPAIMGEATTPLGTASEMLFDSNNAVTVDLLHHQMLLEDADDMRLLAGDNLALLGEELIQYGRAEPLGGTLWRLSRLVRGRRGTGWASDMHHAGERFVVIEAAALAAYDAPASAAGTIVELLASGIGDPVPAAAGASAIGQALRPPAPVHLAARSRADGGFDLAWVRRSRTGWIWIDGVDAPLGEELEAYRLTIVPGNGSLRSYEVAGPTYLYPASDASGDRAVGPEVTVSVVQIGTSASSRPAVIVLTL